MDEDPEMSEEEYKRLRKSQPKIARLSREDFGDPSEIGGFKGPWSRFVGIQEEKRDPRRAKEELSLRKIVNKHCLAAGKERSRSSYVLSMGDQGLSRAQSTRFLIPKNNKLLFHDHKDMVTSLHFFKKHRLLLSSSLDGKVYLYNLKSDELVTTYMGHSKAVSSVALNEAEHRFNTASTDGFLKGWDVETGRCDTRIDALSPLVCMSMGLLSETVFIGGLDGRIRIVDLRSKKVSREIGNGGGSLEGNTFRPSSMFDISAAEDRNVLAFTRREGSLHLLDLRNHEIIKAYGGLYSFAGLDRERDTFIVVNDENVEFFDIPTCERQEEKIKVSGCSTGIRWSDNGNTLCYGDKDGIINFINRKSMETTSLGVSSEMITSIDWVAGSSSNLASGDILGNVKVWE